MAIAVNTLIILATLIIANQLTRLTTKPQQRILILAGLALAAAVGAIYGPALLAVTLITLAAIVAASRLARITTRPISRIAIAAGLALATAYAVSLTSLLKTTEWY